MDYLDYLDKVVNEEYYPEPLVRTVRNRRDPFEMYADAEFRDRFGFTKQSVSTLIDMVGPYLQLETNKNAALSPRLQLLCALRIFRTGNYQIVAGDLINVHRTTAGRVFFNVVQALLALKPLFVEMPATLEQCIDKKRKFYRLGGFPNLIGAIDCTHIRILCPKGPDNEIFRNRKGWVSINTQIICDSNMKILNVVNRWPGSTHDARVWDNSNVAARFEAGDYDGLLVGDSGYVLSKNLMTPVLVPATRGERRYNRAHILSRNVVERTFGVLKKRFQILTKEMRYVPNKCGNVIVASAVLLNFGLEVVDVFQAENMGVEENEPYHEEIADVGGAQVRRA